MTCDLVIGGGLVVSTDGPRLRAEPLSIGINGDRVTYIGPSADAPQGRSSWDLGGRLVTPGLVDAHTHLVFGGDRLSDFERRISGDSYVDIATSGGGIRSTVHATQTASDGELLTSAARRLTWLARSGVTTVEVKSGYGLDLQHELRMLRVAREAARQAPVDVVTTLLGAHVVPAEADRTEYVDMVCNELIPMASGFADAFDVFIESIAFTADEADRMFGVAQQNEMPVKAHVGQLSDIGGAEVAARHGALSIDHCEHVPVTAMAALAGAGTVANLVPGASLFLGDTARPPIDDFRRHGVRVAVTTDLNPGSSPLASLPMAASLSIHRFGLSAGEAFAGITSVAASALGLHDRGLIAVGKRADLAIWDLQDPLELVYWMGAPTCHAVVVGGDVTVWGTP